MFTNEPRGPNKEFRPTVILTRRILLKEFYIKNKDIPYLFEIYYDTQGT